MVLVAARLGIAKGSDATKIEKQLKGLLPQDMWPKIGIAISFLRREMFRLLNPKHDECILSHVCEFCQAKV